MTRSVLEHDDEQRKSAADQMVRSENKIFCRKENQAILGAVGYRALYTFPNRYKRKRREESHPRYLQPIITQYFIDNKSEIWLLFLIAHSKR